MPAVPVSMMFTSSIVPPPVSPAPPAMPPPVPFGSRLKPRTSLPSSSSTTSSFVAVSVGWAPGVGRVQRVGGQRAALVGIDDQALVLADQPLAGVHREAVCRSRWTCCRRRRRRRCGWRPTRSRPGRACRTARRRCRCCPATLLLTYQTQPAIAIVTRPVSVCSGEPRVLDRVVEEVRGVRAARRRRPART